MINKEKIVELFDNQEYQKVRELTNPFDKYGHADYEILFYIKSLVATDNFIIKDKKEMKKLFFYYFYLIGYIEFENNYSFSFNKDILEINFLDLEDKIYQLSNFKQYFLSGKNNIYLNDILDASIANIIEEGDDKIIIAENIIDFFIYFTHQYSELHAFSGEHFPLFKWLINELTK